MNEEKLEKEIGEAHESLNKTLTLLRSIAVLAERSQGTGKECTLECMTAVSDMGLSAEMAADIVQDVYNRLERLPKAIEEA